MRLIPLLLLFLFSCFSKGIYDLKFKDIKGKEFELSSLKGKRSVIYVWSGTCIGHVEDLKALVKLTPQLKERVPVISVAIMMDAEDIRKVLRENGIEPNYPVLADPKGELANMVTLIFLPATLIVDERGKVVGNYPKLPPNLISLVSAHK